MRTHVRLLLLAAVTLALGGWFLGGADRGTAADEKGGFAQIIPEPDANKLIQEDADYVKEKLSNPDPKNGKRARMAAIMIAVYADSAQGAGRGKLAGVRDTALKVAENAKAKDFAAAMKDVNSLKDLKGNGGKGTFPKELDVEDIMRPFGLPSTGGLGIEKELLTLGKARRPMAVNDKKAEQLALYGYRAAAIAQLAKRHPSDDAQKTAANRKKWDEWSDDMEKAAVEFAKAARSKNPQQIKSAVIKLNNSCSQCHEKFRNED
jgi:cytochrome c556